MPLTEAGVEGGPEVLCILTPGERKDNILARLCFLLKQIFNRTIKSLAPFTDNNKGNITFSSIHN